MSSASKEVATGAVAALAALPARHEDTGFNSVSWFRSNGGKVSWIAFFALACHFIVSFGHVHIEHFGVASSVLMKLTDASDHSHAGTAPTAPKKRLRHAPDLCAVCGSINLANALVLPASPGIILPDSFIQKARWSLAAVAPTTYDHFHFYARGPPPPDRLA